MKKQILFIFLLIISITGFAQTEYPLKTIMDIQYLADSVIAQGDFPSPLKGDTIRVRGVIMARPVVDAQNDRRPIIWRGGRWSTFIQDESGEPWGGIVAIQMDTTGDNTNTFFDLVDTAQVVEFTGVVNEYFTTTQYELLLKPVTPVQVVEELAKRPDPIELQITDFMEDGTLKLEAEKYEGMYVVIKNVISSDRNSSTGTFKINDDKGNSMFMLDQSGYWSKQSNRKLTGLTSYEPPQDGTVISYIRGFIESRNTGYYIIPVYPDDIFITKTPPVISSLSRNKAVAAPLEDVTVTAKIKDDDGYVVEAKIKYRVNGGDLTEVDMTKDLQDTTLYSAVIPGVADSALVDYYVWAKDNDEKESSNPSNTTRNLYFYFVLNRPITINEIQYSPFGGGYSAFNNSEVTITGIVTADTSDIPGDGGSQGPRVYIQNGNGPWSGIQLFGTVPLTLHQGDQVTITGIVKESFGVTRIDSISQLVFESGHIVPEPVELSTEDIAALSDGTVAAEQWESVLIKYKDVTVTDENADGAPGTTSNFGEILVSDKSVENFKATRVELQDGNHYWHNLWDSTYIPLSSKRRLFEGDKFAEMTGVLYYSFSNYKLVPRKDDDFVGYIPVSVNDQKSAQAKQYKLAQNYPNPFNPVTTIEYSIPQSGNVSIKIFNILGQEIKSLFNKYQNAGNYKLSFNASDIPSGIYLYQITVNSFTQTKKMVLLK